MQNYLNDLKVISGDLSGEVGFLGFGGDGKVKLHTLDVDGNSIKVAVKTVTRREREWKRKVENLRNEALILQKVSHKNVVKYIGSTATEESFKNLLEYHRRGSLENFYTSSFPEVIENEQPIPWLHSLKLQLASEIREGMLFLHQNHILHLDLKPRNILISSCLNAQICDFGCAYDLKKSDDPEQQAPKGLTYRYAAPEYIASEDNFIPTHKCDVFSFGMLLWSMLAQKIPYQDALESDTPAFYFHHIVKRKQRPTFELIQDQSLRRIIEKCWDGNPNQRPSFVELDELQHEMSESDRRNAQQYFLEQTTQPTQVTNHSQLSYGTFVPSSAEVSSSSTSVPQTSVPQADVSSLSTSVPQTSVLQAEVLSLATSVPQVEVSRLLTSVPQIEKAHQRTNHGESETMCLTTERQVEIRQTKHKCRSIFIKLAAAIILLIILGATGGLVVYHFLQERNVIRESLVDPETTPPTLQIQSSNTVANQVSTTHVSVGRTDDENEELKCPKLTAMDHSIVSCSKGNEIGSTCFSVCNDGYVAEESKAITCLPTQQWSSIPSACKCSNCFNGSSFTPEIDYLPDTAVTEHFALTNSNSLENAVLKCPKLSVPDHSIVSCSKENEVGSTCKTICGDGHVTKESKSITCLPSRQWTSDLSECECPICFTGSQCKVSTSWNALEGSFDRGSWSKFTVVYAGNNIECESKTHGSVLDKIFNLKWDCTCTDKRTRTARKCTKHASSVRSCESALSTLIKHMSSTNIYPFPCDPDLMEPSC